MVLGSTALGTWSTGAYTMTYNPGANAAGNAYGALATGLVEGVRRLRRNASAKMVQADLYGDTDIDGIYRGGNVYLAMVLKEWTAINRAILWPYATGQGAGSNALFGDLGLVGSMYSDMAGILVLTPVAGTLAAQNGPLTITAKAAIIAPNNDVEIVLGNEARDIPILLKLFPYNDSGTIRHFSCT